MKHEELPLLNIFKNLRQQHGLLLGVDEYMVVLRSLQAGLGVESRQELEELCCLVWAKSEQENHLIRQIFEKMWQILPTQSGNQVRGIPEPRTLPESNISLPEKPTVTKPLSDASSDEKPAPEPSQVDELAELESKPTIIPEPLQTVQAVRSSRQDRLQIRPHYSLLSEYFPVTKRQMKQSWRYLRRPVREGIPIELDVEATVAKIGHEGMLLTPVLIPRLTNRTDLVLLIDQEGSMVPFHDLSRQLVETAERGGRLRQTHVFYFHDYADDYLYRHPALLDAQPISEVMEEIGQRAVVLIVSDAGAARGNFDQERVEETKQWIEQLQQSVRYCAWLNPMPNEYWRDTTAGEIARLLPMFEMSRQGMNGAISVLRGRYVAWEKMYSWLI
ncbi:MAG: hypothetical protein QNJ34_23945 [Xenococcaceae cyanobacterium MO_188.B29]|nr:hypothetical protein [Xenococcaceae cyanobacterium MO_188.B29]